MGSSPAGQGQPAGPMQPPGARPVGAPPTLGQPEDPARPPRPGAAPRLPTLRNRALCGLPTAACGGPIPVHPERRPPQLQPPGAPTLNPDARLQRAPLEGPHPRACGGRFPPLTTGGPAPAAPNDRPRPPQITQPRVLSRSPRSLPATPGRRHKPWRSADHGLASVSGP